MFTFIYSGQFALTFRFFFPRMSYDSVKKQHAEINRTFEGRYDELSGIAIAVKDGLKRLVAANQLDEDAAVWALRSLDFRKRPHMIVCLGEC